MHRLQEVTMERGSGEEGFFEMPKWQNLKRDEDEQEDLRDAGIQYEIVHRKAVEIFTSASQTVRSFRLNDRSFTMEIIGILAEAEASIIPSEPSNLKSIKEEVDDIRSVCMEVLNKIKSLANVRYKDLYYTLKETDGEDRDKLMPFLRVLEEKIIDFVYAAPIATKSDIRHAARQKLIPKNPEDRDKFYLSLPENLLPSLRVCNYFVLEAKEELNMIAGSESECAEISKICANLQKCIQKIENIRSRPRLEVVEEGESDQSLEAGDEGLNVLENDDFDLIIKKIEAGEVVGRVAASTNEDELEDIIDGIEASLVSLRKSDKYSIIKRSVRAAERQIEDVKFLLQSYFD